MNGWRIALGSVDERVLHALVARRHRVLDVIMRAVTHLADVHNVVAIVLALALGVVPELRDAGLAAAWALTVSHVAVHQLKRRFLRPRPSMPVGFQSLIEPPDKFSFPSGHAAAALSVTLPVALALGGGLGWSILALGLLVGVTRCYLGVHYPGDVLVGWVLAALGVFSAGPIVGISL